MIHTILFDLDGTLLPMNQEQFIAGYFGELAKKVAPLGYAPDVLIQAIWAGTKAMIDNDGVVRNEVRFWDTFAAILGNDIREAEPLFYAFYQHEFQKVKAVTQPTPLANACIKLCKAKGYRLVLATNPIFPSIATMSRIAWAGLDADDFMHVTTYENSGYCKPNLSYYQEILTSIDVAPEHCLMIGNDVAEDMCTTALGMQGYLVQDCLIGETDGNGYAKGSLAELYDYLLRLPDLTNPQVA